MDNFKEAKSLWRAYYCWSQSLMHLSSYIATKNKGKTKLEVSIEHIPCMERLCCGYGCHLEWTVPHPG